MTNVVPLRRKPRSKPVRNPNTAAVDKQGKAGLGERMRAVQAGIVKQQRG